MHTHQTSKTGECLAVVSGSHVKGGKCHSLLFLGSTGQRFWKTSSKAKSTLPADAAWRAPCTRAQGQTQSGMGLGRPHPGTGTEAAVKKEWMPCGTFARGPFGNSSREAPALLSRGECQKDSEERKQQIKKGHPLRSCMYRKFKNRRKHSSFPHELRRDLGGTTM